MRLSSLLMMAVLIGLAGCSSLSEQQCRDADKGSWESIGRADARGGWDAAQRLEMHRSACSPHGIAPQMDAYMKGWNLGVPEYCVAAKGYEAGREGSAGNPAICPASLRASFQEGWMRGILEHCSPDNGYTMGLRGYSETPALCPDSARPLFHANLQLGRKIYRLTDEIDDTRSEIRRLEKQLTDKNIAPDRARDLRARVRQRESELFHLKALLIEAQAAPVIRQ